MMPDLRLWRQILVLAGPLILSMTASMLMQFIDGLFLARYSAEAIAAVGPASMASFCFGSLVTGAVGYTSVLAAQYFGAGQVDRVASATWQGIWLSLLAGLLAAALGLLGAPLFALAGHPLQIQTYEVQYFTIICAGMGTSFLSTAISGFFTGRGKTLTVMNIQFSSIALNTVLAYALIFGRLGFAAHGVAGAAAATVTAQAFAALLFLICFLTPANRARFHTWRARRWNADMMTRLVRFGIPNGFRFFTEVLAWSFFLFFIGRIGVSELAATTIAWRVNTVAFFPLIGLSEAVKILVGHAQGRGELSSSTRVTWQGLMISEFWMLAAAALFVIFPRQWYGLFLGSDPGAAAITGMGVVLLRFVAVYCLMDAANVVVCGALVAAGDTRWTFWANLVVYGIFVALLWAADVLKLGLMVEWAIATVFVMALASIWLARFLSGRWRGIRVIEAD